LTKRGLNQRFFQNALKNICKEIPNLIEENFPEYLMKTFKFMSRQHAFLNVHFPRDMEHFDKADFRLKFEESFFFQLGYGLKSSTTKHSLMVIRSLLLGIISTVFTKIIFLLSLPMHRKGF
jgi:RecG-like helicase